MLSKGILYDILRYSQISLYERERGLDMNGIRTSFFLFAISGKINIMKYRSDCNYGS